MLRNTTRALILAQRPRIAASFAARARGMIGLSFDHFDGLILPECSSVHTWFMNQPLDLIFVGGAGITLKIEIEAGPWRFFFGPEGTKTVIELPAATLYGIPLERGDILSWQPSA